MAMIETATITSNRVKARLLPNLGKREESQDSLQYSLKGDKYLKTDCFLAEKQENNLQGAKSDKEQQSFSLAINKP